MKRITAYLLASLFILTMTACAGNDDQPTDKPTVSSGETTVATDPAAPTAPTDPDDPDAPTDPEKPVSTASKGGSTMATSSEKTTKSTKTTQTTKSTATTKGGETNYDKPWVEHVALPGDPTASGYDAKAAAIRKSVKANRGTVKVTGTTWYISPSGNDKNSGKSKSEAWQSIDGMVKHQNSIKSGDAVLFECGGVYRYGGGYVYLKSGVYYGAYGTGDKPCLYGSAQNYATATWTDQKDGTWRLETRFGGDVGNVIFNHGEQVGYKRDTRKELKNEYDFCLDRTTKRVFVKLSKNPTTAFKDIEIPSQGAFLYMNAEAGTTNRNVYVEDLVIKYAGDGVTSHGDLNGFTVRNCEFGFIGGTYLSGFGDGKTRAGNGVTTLGNPTNVLIENCWFHQIYDSGVSFQGFGTVNGFTLRNCLMEYCGMGAFEYWGCTVKKAELSDNLMRFSGYGFGGKQRKDQESRAAIQSNGKPGGPATNKVEGSYVIKNNIFDQSAYQLINSTSVQNQLPTYSGNTYVQKKGGVLGYYKASTDIPFDDNVANIIKTVIGDKTATVKFQ